jgi:hypothetical protein
MLAASLINGRFLDKEFARVRRNIAHQQSPGEKGEHEDAEIEDITKHESFPIERARLSLLPIYLVIFMCCVVPYGWVLRQRVSLAAPLILHVLSETYFQVLFKLFTYAYTVGYCTFSIMNTTMTLTIDLTPGRSSAVTACVCNLRLHKTTRAEIFLAEQFHTGFAVRSNGFGHRHHHPCNGSRLDFHPPGLHLRTWHPPDFLGVPHGSCMESTETCKK